MNVNLRNISGFNKNIATIMTGSALAQASVFLFSPILTRIYSPSEYGKVAVFIAIQTILAVAANLHYAQAVMVDKEDRKAKGTVYVAITSSFLVATVTAVGCLIYGLAVETDVLTRVFLVILPVETFIFGVRDASNVWNNRSKMYRYISAATIVNSLTQSLVSIGLGLLGMGALGLLLGKFTALVCNAVLLIFVMLQKTNFKAEAVDHSLIKSQAIKHKQYPIFNMPSQILNTASSQVPIVLFSSFFGDFITGSYTKASSLTQLPLGLVGSAIGTVFFQEASKINNHSTPEALRKFTLSTYRKLLLASIAPLFALTGFGDVLFQFVLGAQWYNSGRFAAILAPWFMLQFITSPLSTILYIKERHKQNAAINVLLILSRVGIVAAFGYAGIEFIPTLFAVSVTGCIIWSFLNSYMLKLAGVRYKDSIVPGILVIGGTLILARLIRLAFGL